MISEKMFEMLAIDLGLIIIAGWFYILLLMFREFKTVSGAINRFTSSHLFQNNTTEDTKSVGSSEFMNDDRLLSPGDSSKLNELIKVNSKIEALFSTELIGESEQLQLHKDEITLLNNEMKKSNELIKKLKNNMIGYNTDKELLEDYRTKLSKQEMLIKKTRIMSDKVNVENDQLKLQITNQVKMIKHTTEQGKLYSQKLIKQGKELEYLKAKLTVEGNTEGSAKFNTEIETLTAKLADSKEKLQRVSTEKEFLETQFLSVLEEYEESPEKAAND